MTTKTILLDHGSGGKMSADLTRKMLLPALNNPILSPLHDGALVDWGGQRLAFSTDTFVVDPIFFAGGSIGSLAVNGTVNDLAMCGAAPRFLALALVIEEGLPANDLEKIIADIASAAGEAGVMVVTGDTKVVPKGAADKIFITTSGIGGVDKRLNISSHTARPKDKIILSGSIADHGMAIMSQREGISLGSPIKSDTAPLHRMVEKVLAACREIRVLRDPTRGGVGAALNEIAAKSGIGVRIHEDAIPVKKEVAALCELLGFDPLYVANEGKLIAFAPPDAADAVLAAMRACEGGENARIIGEAFSGPHPGRVVMETCIGGTRIVEMPPGEQLPRIC